MEFVDRLPVTDEDCYYLEHLHILVGPDHGLTDDEAAYVLQDCPNIITAELSGIRDLTDRTLDVLAATSTRLRHLDISGCVEISDVGLLQLAANATHLRTLKLNGIIGLRDPALSALALSLPHLTELELCDMPLLTAKGVRDIWTFSRRLSHLKLSNCPQLTDKAFPYPPEWASLGISPAPLSLNNNSNAHPRPPTWLESLPSLVLGPSHNFSDLRFLDLSKCAKLTDVSIAGIVAHAPRIRHLDLSGCAGLTDTSAQSVCVLGKYLHVLSLSNLDQLTDYGIVRIGTVCTQLKSVDISYNRRLTDLSILELGSLPRIRRLCAAGLPRLTDVAVLFLAEHASALERLHLSHCKKLSLDAVHCLLRNISTLQKLSASGVPAFKRPGVERFSDPVPEGYDEARDGIFRVYRGPRVGALRDFLGKELGRLRESERRNIIFMPRADDGEALY